MKSLFKEHMVVFIATALFVLVVTLASCVTKDNKKDKCEEYALAVKAAFYCSSDPKCQSTYDMYKNGLERLEYLKNNCLLGAD